VEVAVAVEVEEERPLAAVDEQRLPADAAEGAGRAVDAAGDHFTGAGEGVTAANTFVFHIPSLQPLSGPYFHASATMSLCRLAASRYHGRTALLSLSPSNSRLTCSQA